MCLDWMRAKNWTTPFGTLHGKTVARIFKTITRIVKSVAARCLYTLYGFIAVWRVTEAKQESAYWLLLFALCPLGLETIHAVFRRGNEMKWLTPSILFYLLIGIPCVWLMELKLFDDRLIDLEAAVNSNQTSNTSQAASTISPISININLSDSGWTLALEQIMIFVLVLGKWIGPKGEMSRNELSQLLLVNIAAGADIIELLEVFGEDQVSENKEIVFLVMAMWSWSLLQFCFVLTASKDLPPLDGDQDEELMTYEDIKESSKSDTLTTEPEVNTKKHKDSLKVPMMHNGKQTNASNDIRSQTASRRNGARIESDCKNSNGKSLRTREAAARKNQLTMNGAPILVETQSDFGTLDGTHATNSSAADAKKEDELKSEKMVDNVVKGRYCFECFCCYTEIWGMVMSMVFQDGPFFILRMFIMFHYKVVTHMNVFFTLKNALVILLLLNRIRVIVLEDHKPWKKNMIEAKLQRFREENARRRQRGLPPKKPSKLRDKGQQDDKMHNKQNDRSRPSTREGIAKPRWITWRS